MASEEPASALRGHQSPAVGRQAEPQPRRPCAESRALRHRPRLTVALGLMSQHSWAEASLLSPLPCPEHNLLSSVSLLPAQAPGKPAQAHTRARTQTVRAGAGGRGQACRVHPGHQEATLGSREPEAHRPQY